MPKAKEVKPKKPAGKIKSDAETINELVAKKAYELYEKRGGSHGNDIEDWLQAEKIVKAEMERKK